MSTSQQAELSGVRRGRSVALKLARPGEDLPVSPAARADGPEEGASPGRSLAPAEIEELLRGLRAITDPTRLRVLQALRGGEVRSSDLEQALGLPQSLLSHHLQVLRQAGLVISRRGTSDGRWIYSRLNHTQLSRLSALYQVLLAPLAGSDPSSSSQEEPPCR